MFKNFVKEVNYFEQKNITHFSGIVHGCAIGQCNISK